MKKLMILALLFVIVFQSKSQGFEGSVSWTMKMDISDPKMKAQMADAQAKMNDPKMQAQMKALQDKMNDPQFKAQMEANPQMKAQMEGMMKMMQPATAGGSPGSGMMPTGMTMKLKGGNAITIINGGMMNGMETLYIKDKNESVKLDRASKTYSILPSSGMSTGQQDKMNKMADVKFTKTGETMKILGYNCVKYVGTMTEGGKTVNESFWTTTELKDLDLKALGSQRMSASNRPMIPAGLEGTPLRIEMAMPEGSMIMEMSELKKGSLPASDFVIPSDFKEVKMGMGRM